MDRKGGAAVLNRVFRDCVTKRVAFELRPNRRGGGKT